MAVRLLRKTDEGHDQPKAGSPIKSAMQRYRGAVQALETTNQDHETAQAKAADLRLRLTGLEREAARLNEERRRVLSDFAAGAASEAEVRDQGSALRSIEEEVSTLRDMLVGIEENIGKYPAKLAAAKQEVEQARRSLLEVVYADLKSEAQRVASGLFLKCQAARGLCGWDAGNNAVASDMFGPDRIEEITAAQKQILTSLDLDD